MVFKKNLAYIIGLIYMILLSYCNDMYANNSHKINLNNINTAFANSYAKEKNISIDPELEKFRKKIDNVDTILLKTLAERMKLSKKVGEYKKNKNMPIYQKDRYKELINNRLILSEKLGLDKDFVLQLFNLIHDSSVKIQQKLNK